MRENKIYTIELLRFFSSLLVIIWHYQHFFNPYILKSKVSLEYFDLHFLYSFPFGLLGVYIFFCISGFVFSHIYLKNKNNISLYNFFVNRFARLYPLNFISLIIVAILQYANYINFNHFNIYTHNDLYHFLLNLFFISGWGFEAGASFNAPIWSVSVEIFIYFLFFSLIFHIKKLRLFIIIPIIFVCIILDKSYLINNIFVTCATLFFLGVLVHHIYNSNLKNNKKIFFLSIFLISISLIGNFKVNLFCPGILLLFLAFERSKNLTDDIKKKFISLGNLTYSSYLWHIPIQLMIIYIFNFYNNLFNIFINPFFLIIFIFIVYIFSHYSYEYFEKPLNKIIRKKLK
tara:strand:- start:300 stop:1334 length:1035 start_codon:yes stop_codon:yes gene_type:complete